MLLKLAVKSANRLMIVLLSLLGGNPLLAQETEVSTLPSVPVAEVKPETGSIGRPVRVVSLSFNSKSFTEVTAIITKEARRGTDLIILPETWRGQNNDSREDLTGETIKVLAGIAKRHRTYIVSPIDRLDGARRLNTAVLINREGKVAKTYDKVFPYWNEFEKKQPVSVGDRAPVFETDFGRLGIAICFDVNFPEVWQRLADQGAELVVWPSAYSAGSSLQAHAINHHYYIVNSTWSRDCQVYDITGQKLLDEKNEDINVSRITLDLDRGIYHHNFNQNNCDKLLQEHAEQIEQEMNLNREAWFVLRAKQPGVSARKLAQEYGLEELRHYINRSRNAIDAMRGWRFADEVLEADMEHVRN